MMQSTAHMMLRRALTAAAVQRLPASARASYRAASTRSIVTHARALKNARPVQHFSHQFSTAMSTSTSDKKADRHEFQAETRQLLDIVTHSIYTDKEVFIRELISNASDALEKLRHLQATGEAIENPELEPKIIITTDEKARTLTIQDTGMGMTKAELIDNLGTIARSGSKAFLEKIKQEQSPNASTEALSGIIGKFGVGFYSAFMVADKVEVFSHSALSGNQSHVWSSDGSGAFEVAPTDEDVSRGCKIVIHVKESCKDFLSAAKVEAIICRYSNFVAFPITVNGEPVNTVQALWTKSESEVTEEEYSEFYKFIANAFDDPLYRLQYRADAPLELKTLFFIGSSHTEKHGYSRLEPGVSLYSRKVLIERNSPDILPDWMRFVRGVVDSEDLPLSLSREKMQDSRLIVKLRDVLTRRIIRFLEQQSTKDPEKFKQFFKEFGQFIKEGICTDFQNKNSLAKLLHYESSQLESEVVTTLDEYVSRCPPDQNEIYYLCAPSRKIAEMSPYFEAFKKSNKEVLFVYNPIDDFVMTNVAEFNGRKIVSAEAAKLDMSDLDDPSVKKLTEDEERMFGAWLKLTLEKEIKDVKFTSRLSESPAIISDHESASIRQMMSLVNERTGQDLSSGTKYTLEINPRHRIIVDLNTLREVNAPLAEKVARQIYTNATVAAGLVGDGRTLLTGLNDILAVDPLPLPLGPPAALASIARMVFFGLRSALRVQPASVAVFLGGVTAGFAHRSTSAHAESDKRDLRDLEFGVPQERKRVDPFSPFFPSDKHPCTHAGMFIPGCHELKIFSGSSHFELADDIARRLGTRVGKMKLGRFADGEVQVQIGESVRGKDVYLVQSLAAPVNENVIELLLMVSTMRRASAKRVTVVIPYYAYKHHRRANPMSTSMNSKFIHSPAGDIAKMLEVMGVDRVIAVDLQLRMQGHEACFFSSGVPVETLETIMAGVEYFATQVHLRRPLVVLSPNPECLRRARVFQSGLNKWLPDSPARFAAFIRGTSGGPDFTEADIVGDVKGADVIVVDDLIDTSETLAKLTKLCKEKGARKIYCFASHPLLNGEAEQVIHNSDVSEVIVMDTIPATPGRFHSDKIKRLSVAPMLAELIQAEHFKAHSYIDRVNSREDFKYSHSL
ncbi:TPA: hypothetical protein N0F65_002869 [Lagenidium giganteum]|uniref:Heat shock protein 75 kDa, mitochondrial n=2 Tax=Lagenidium giganteum TaxID=4803 RepID=A0AAV2Z7V5_9STRA|nr:TPA: hypothetical protein N0F65_002869 [Lagenidium giganteum]